VRSAASDRLVIVDATGLKVYGKDEWHQEKHDVAARRTWRKLHLAIAEYHQILACELTTPEVGDPSAVPDLLTQMSSPFETFMGRRRIRWRTGFTSGSEPSTQRSGGRSTA